MEQKNRLIIVIAIIVFALIFAGANYAISSGEDVTGRQYRVDASRAAAIIQADGIDSVDIADYPTLTAILSVDSAQPEQLEGGNSD